MVGKELFTRNTIESRDRTPQRPLREVSNFVVEKLPTLVTLIDSNKVQAEQLLQEVNDVLSRIDHSIITHLLQLAHQNTEGSPNQLAFNTELDQAAFDLKMLEIALVTYGEQPPTELTQLVDTFSEATGQLPMITYEDLIYINPESDPRTFTMGEVGNSEYDFYFGHLRIERVLETVTQQVEQAAQLLQQETPQVPQAIAALEEAVQLFSEAQQDMHAVGMDLPKDHFAIFRKFFNTHPTRELKGPSGAFTAAVPVLDMRLGGENLEPSYFNYLQDNEMYFPRTGRQEMAHAYQKIEAGETLSTLSAGVGNPEELVNVLHALSDQVRQFRGQHYRGVRHQIPEAVTGNLMGTGGEEDPGQFLRGRMRMRHIKGTKNAT